ncbi:AP-1 complex subunit beta-1 [Gonapodya sp. JEL0774]|nr:AP-1 complex subunit beta-1 [Gonapodya sp. JEL0774]
MCIAWGGVSATEAVVCVVIHINSSPPILHPTGLTLAVVAPNRAVPKSKFFTAAKKGENFELKAELNSEYKDKRKDAVKRVIANMTVGKDVSSLFADVVKNMQTEDLELKKLVYLYLINYAKSQPELVILAVNTFVKDTDDINPLIRALAIRTMGCLRVDKIVDYLGSFIWLLYDYLGRQDENPYVRKTAAICVAKLYDLNPTLATDNGFLTTLQDMLSDSNPMVVANAVAALGEINESAGRNVFQVNSQTLSKLLGALNDSTEWGQICILKSLAEYTPQDSREAESIVEKVLPRFQHANGSVVLGAVRVIMIYFNYVTNEEVAKQMSRKLAPPLVTLLSAEPELAYVALRNINIVLQKREDIFNQDMRVFFCKFNDPPYVKLEKLDVIIRLCNEKNVDQVLSELKEYANEVDVDFVRKSVNAIGRVAIKVESATERCVNLLLELVKGSQEYVVQEVIIVIKDVCRKYPRRYESIVPILCQHTENLEEPVAKAALIWLVGEHAERVENSAQLLNGYLENFKEEYPQVQLQLLTATVKMFLKRPTQGQEQVQRVLQLASQGSDNPDLRDRAYVYWRLLSTNPQAAKTVVLSEKPPIESSAPVINQSLLDELIHNIAYLSSVYHKPASTLGGSSSPVAVTTIRPFTEIPADETQGGPAPMAAVKNEENLLDLDFDDEGLSTPGIGVAPSSASTNAMSDLLDVLGSPSSAQPSGLNGLGFGAPPTAVSKQIVLPAAVGKGLEIAAGVSRPGQVMQLTFTNKGTVAIPDFAIQFNKNSYGLFPAVALQVPSPLGPNQSAEVTLPLVANPQHVQVMNPPNLLQVAIKAGPEVHYFNHSGDLGTTCCRKREEGTIRASVATTDPLSPFTLPTNPEKTWNRMTSNGHVTRVKPEIDWKNLGFSYIKTHSHIEYKWKKGQGWDDGKLVTEPFLNLHIAATGLHYGQSAFEGLKAYRMKDGKVRLFRPDKNAERMQISADAVCMVAPPPSLFLEACRRVIIDNLDFVPPYGTGGSLYVRPLLFGSGPQIGLHEADEYTFLVLAIPVGEYYKGGVSGSVKALIRNKLDRAAPHGTGHAKLGGNYPAAIGPVNEAQKIGYQLLLFLDPASHTYVDEFSSSNFIALTAPDADGRRTYVTTKSESILNSVTNRTLREIAEKKLGWKVDVRKVAFEEVKQGNFTEVGACGTAAVISPVGMIGYEHEDGRIEEVKIGDGSVDGWKALFKEFSALQVGESDGWEQWGYHWPLEGI